MRRTDIPPGSGISVLIDSSETGLCLLHDPRHHALHIFNHIEYDSTTLADEYFRDRDAGRSIHLPRNYFPGDCETLHPRNQWRGHAHLLFGNWINRIFQTAPADLATIGHPKSDISIQRVRSAQCDAIAGIGPVPFAEALCGRTEL